MRVFDEWSMRCPKCGRDDGLQIVITTFARLTPDGTEDVGDHEWEDDSVCRCGHCYWAGKVSDAKIEEGEQS